MVIGSGTSVVGQVMCTANAVTTFTLNRPTPVPG